ncbi:hypothetical protein EON66_11955 [archaeon]|nr:MAG: hypothetical protein EON66_11955 [archaeon]
MCAWCRCDVAAARDGFAMAKMLAAADPASVKAQVLVWDEPRVVLTHFLDTLSALNASTASAAVPCVDASCVAAPASLSVPREA